MGVRVRVRMGVLELSSVTNVFIFISQKVKRKLRIKPNT